MQRCLCGGCYLNESQVAAHHGPLFVWIIHLARVGLQPTGNTHIYFNIMEMIVFEPYAMFV